MPIDLGLDGAVIVLEPPPLPEVTAAPPRTSTASVVAVVGPPGAVSLSDVDLLIDVALDAHVNADEPHPAYDDIHSLVLIFENHLI